MANFVFGTPGSGKKPQSPKPPAPTPKPQDQPPAAPAPKKEA